MTTEWTAQRIDSLRQSQQRKMKLSRNQIVKLCSQHGAIDPSFMYWVVRYALWEGDDPRDVFAQLARNQPAMFKRKK